ncbi:hypothetical protein [Hydrogenophaga luteola]|uniref:Uncharacterized protein n=1 Tax=Hydrogenophaga luteola TaxID=1591122 RepID=A0ABV7W464_9BURK
MIQPPLDEQERADALVLAALLRSSVRTLGPWSLGWSLLAALVCVVWPPISLVGASGWALVLLCGVIERYLVFRLALDERLFCQLGQGQMPCLQALDTSLAHLGLRKESVSEHPPAVRPMGDRLRGTRHLLRWHLVLVVLQTAAALATLFF